MGYEAEIIIKLLETTKSCFNTFTNLNILEFGNQEVYSNFEKVKYIYSSYNYNKDTRVLKYFFEHLGMKHTSIDYNGKDGALPYDVRTDLLQKLSPNFDLITNIGFSEHVGENDTESNLLINQYNFFKNIHNLGNSNTLYYHCVPLTNYWYKHGVCDYSLDFFSTLCTVCDYTIILGPFVEDYHKELQASIFYKKTSNKPFISFEEFCNIDGIRSTYKD